MHSGDGEGPGEYAEPGAPRTLANPLGRALSLWEDENQGLGSWKPARACNIAHVCRGGWL